MGGRGRRPDTPQAEPVGTGRTVFFRWQSKDAVSPDSRVVESMLVAPAEYVRIADFKAH